MTESRDTSSEGPAPAKPGRFARAWRRRSCALLAVAIAAGCLLLVAVASFGYVWWGSRTPEGSGPAYLTEWQRAVRWHPEDVRARIELAYAYRQLGENAAALEHLDYAVLREPLNTGARYNRGMVYLSVGKEKKAEEDLWLVLRAEPDHVLAAVALGDYYAKKGQYRSLLVAVRPVLEEQPRIARLQYLAGIAYENTGHPDWATTRYTMALELDPDMLEARRGLDRLENGR